MNLSAAKRIGIWQQFHKVKSCKVFPWGTTNVKNAAGGLPMWEAQVGQIHLSCPGACLSQEPWGHSCLMNIFVGEMIAGFPNYVWIPCARVACDLELKVWVILCALDLKTFAACWFAAWEFDERNECFLQKKSAYEHNCTPSIHGLRG